MNISAGLHNRLDFYFGNEFSYFIIAEAIHYKRLTLLRLVMYTTIVP
jgi:hypothetical protein